MIDRLRSYVISGRLSTGSNVLILGISFMVATLAAGTVMRRLGDRALVLVLALIVWFVVGLAAAVLASATNCALHGGCPY